MFFQLIIFYYFIQFFVLDYPAEYRRLQGLLPRWSSQDWLAVDGRTEEAFPDSLEIQSPGLDLDLVLIKPLSRTTNSKWNRKNRETPSVPLHLFINLIQHQSNINQMQIQS